MNETSSRGPARYANGRFGPGHTGRPPGARNRMSRRVANALLSRFAENEAEILDRIEEDYFGDYLRLIGRLLPRPSADDAPELETMPAEDVEQVLGEVRAAIGRIEAGEGTLADIEDALAGVPVRSEAAVDKGAETARPAAAQRGERRRGLEVEIVRLSEDPPYPGALPDPAPPLNMDKIW